MIDFNLLQLAENEDTEAQLEVARRYMYGDGCDIDYIEAYKWFIAAAKSSKTEDLYNRSNEGSAIVCRHKEVKDYIKKKEAMHYNSLVEKQKKTALEKKENLARLDIEVVAKEAEAGDIEACLNMVKLYVYGSLSDSSSNLTEARDWYMKALSFASAPEERELCYPLLSDIESAEYASKNAGNDDLLNVYLSMTNPPDATCPICGTRIHREHPIDDEEITDVDLDLRCVGTYRWAERLFVSQCDKCAFVLGTGAEKVIHRQFLNSRSYVTCDGIVFKDIQESSLTPPNPRKYYQKHLLSIAVGNYKDAMFDLLHAAWECDDLGDEQNAITCRKKALLMHDKACESDDVDASCLLVKIDMLRRTNQFDKLLKEIPFVRERIGVELLSSNNIVKSKYKQLGSKEVEAILLLQEKSALHEDDNCHTLFEALSSFKHL